MRPRLDQLKREIIEEGRGHPFVEALIAALVTRLQALLESLEAQSASGGAGPSIYATGGRASEVRNLIGLITKTEGVPE